MAVSRRVVLLGVLGLALPARAAERVGKVDFVRQGAKRIVADGASRALYADDPVFFRETVATVPEGALHLGLADGSEFRLGSDCRVVLDEFVYDPGTPQAGRIAADVTRGIARFVTGTIKTNFRVRTPTATIGVRGTDFSVWVEEENAGRTTIWVSEGEIEVTPVAGGAAALVGEDETVKVEPGGTTVDRDAPRPASDPGLSPRLRLRPNR